MGIVVDDVSFGFEPKRSVLNRITLAVSSGDLLAIVGPSGCGKSTLLRLIAGVLPRAAAPNWFEGEISLDGIRPSSSSMRPGTVSLMFQEPLLLPNRSVSQNVALPLEMLGLPPEGIPPKVAEVVEAVGLSSFANYRPSELSVGMKTRVSLAMTVVTRPAFLLLDEPFASLDIGWRFSLYRAVTDIQASQKPSTVLVTHDLHEAVLLANRIVVIDSRGHKRDEFTVDIHKPKTFGPEELSAYNASSIRLYSALEQSVLDATNLVSSPSEES